ncbi:MAG: hypothetical protein KGJ86_01315, partial [Chloroflexota bacterium]|nr:hypothetical protein [Chloroflexota bacterium]
HYREIEGYDDQRKVFVSTDSYLGPNHEITYTEFDRLWARGNQRFMVIYPPAKAAQLDAALKGAGWDKATAYQADLARQLRGEDVMQQVPGRTFWRVFPGSRELNLAWDYIQLGQLDQAKAHIANAPGNARSAQLVQWLNQAMAVAS